MGAHADYFEERPQNCYCDLESKDGEKGFHVVRVREDCPMHGRPENLSDDATARERRNAEVRWS